MLKTTVCQYAPPSAVSMTKKGRKKIKEKHDIIFTPSAQPLDPNQPSKKHREREKKKMKAWRKRVSKHIKKEDRQKTKQNNSLRYRRLNVHITGNRIKTFLSLKEMVHPQTNSATGQCGAIVNV